MDESIRAYACLENYVAFRSPEGAEFIECVHKVFLEYADKENIDDLLKRVRSYTIYFALISRCHDLCLNR